MTSETRESVRASILRSLEAKSEHSRNATILVVDDDSDMREALAAFLGLKYEVVGLGSGHDLLKMVDAYAPDMIILDVNLPGRDGFQLCRAIRNSPRHRRLPVLFLTARIDDASIVRGIQENADAYLNKPVEPAELTDTVSRLLESAPS